uniref:Uncharacterized protein n=1 Tax=Tanacetum cinerariifolium TaxID=118510 RepID=A0A699GPK7_TANCI|nr:hypothetical protein [Tanacetum cinerariifolium]
MIQCKADEFRALGGESARVEYPSFGVAQGVSLAGTHNVIKAPSRVMSTGHGNVYSVSDISNFNPVSINVWSMLTKEQRDGVIDIVGVLLDSLLSNDNDITREKPSDPIVQSVDINPTPTSYAGAAGASTIGHAKVHSNFHTLVAEPICDVLSYLSLVRLLRRLVYVLNILDMGTLLGGPWLIRKSSIILKKRSMDTRLLKEELTRISIWVKLHDVPIQIFEEGGISLIATFIGKHVMLDSYTSAMCNDSWGQSSFARCLIEVNSEADLVNVVTIVSLPLLGKIPLRKQSELSMNGGRPDVMNKKKGKAKSTNASQFVGPSVKQNFKYEPKATTSQPKKGATNVVNVSKSSPKLKSTNTSSKEGNIATSNSYFALENDEDEDEEHVENVHDESANLFQL